MMVRFSMMVRFPSSFMTLRIFTLKRATGGETAQYRDGRGRENKTLFYDGTLSFIFYDATDFFLKRATGGETAQYRDGRGRENKTHVRRFYLFASQEEEKESRTLRFSVVLVTFQRLQIFLAKVELSF